MDGEGTAEHAHVLWHADASGSWHAQVSALAGSAFTMMS